LKYFLVLFLETAKMSRRFWTGGILLGFAALTVSISANAQSPLQWKGFKEKGKKFYQTMTTETTQKMTVMDQNVEQKQNQTFWIEWEPLGEDKDKNYTVRQTIIGVKMDIQIGGNTISFDSTAKEKQPQNPLTDFFNALVGADFVLTIKPDMTVAKIEKRKEFIDRLTNANNALKPLLDQILSEKAMTQMFDQSFAVLPTGKQAEKLEPGKTKWEKKDVTLDLGPIGSYRTTYDYTYEGKDKENSKLDKIGVKANLKYEAPAAAKDAGLPFKIKSATLGSEKAEGTVIFDQEKGRIERSNMDMTIKGDLKIEVGGMETTVNLVQTQASKLLTSDKNPIQK
jgi:hypothetical protein